MGHFHQNRKTKQAPLNDLWEGLHFGDVILQFVLWDQDICFQGGVFSLTMSVSHPGSFAPHRVSHFILVAC
jgi:hypothetical protein